MLPKETFIGHPVIFAKGMMGTFKKAWWEIPEIMCSSFMALLGIGMATYGLGRYLNNQGDYSEYKSVFYIVRPEDPRACKLKNPTFTVYEC